MATRPSGRAAQDLRLVVRDPSESSAASIWRDVASYLASCSAFMSTSTTLDVGLGQLEADVLGGLELAVAEDDVSRSSCRFWKPVTADRSTTSILVSTTGLSSMRR